MWRVLQRMAADRREQTSSILPQRPLHIWGARFLAKPPRVPLVTNFLAERLVSVHPPEERARLIENLYLFVNRSKSKVNNNFKEDFEVQAAASNAMTVLAWASVPFTAKRWQDKTFFRGIRIPHADLSMAELSGVDLSWSDLSFCRMVGTKLTSANLSFTNFNEVHFQQLAPFRGHEDAVTSVAMSADGLRIVSGLDDKTVRVWGADGTPGLILTGHTRIVSSVAISADGQCKCLAHGTGLCGCGEQTARQACLQRENARNMLEMVYVSQSGERNALATGDYVVRPTVPPWNN